MEIAILLAVILLVFLSIINGLLLLLVGEIARKALAELQQRSRPRASPEETPDRVW